MSNVLRYTRSLIVAVAVAVATASAQTVVTFSDGEFTDWTSDKIEDTTPNMAATFEVETRTTGGNPGAFRHVVHIYGVGLIGVGHLHDKGIYDLKQEGAISAIDYSWDLIQQNPPFPTAGVAYSLLIFQDGTYYRNASRDLVLANGLAGFGMVGIAAADFVRVGDTGPSQPDFSPSGSPIQFGYMSRNSHTGSGTAQRESGIDNWLVTIHSNPAQAETVTFSTGEFVDSEWSTNISGTGSSEASTQPTGGNHGAFRRVSLTVDLSQNVVNRQLWNVAVFTPATQGPVSSVSVSYDLARVFTSNPGATQVSKGIAVQQDGVLYGLTTGVSTAAPPTWESFSVTDIVPLFPAVNWTNGNQITFGFQNAVSTSQVGFTIDGGYDNFSVTVNFDPPISGVPSPTLPPNSVVNGASFRAATEPDGAIAPGAIVAIFGTDLAGDTLLASEVPLPTTLGDTSVTFDNIPAPLFFVFETQINAQVPFELMAGAGTVTVQITRGGETSAVQPIAIAAVSPGIFTLNQQGTGAGAIQRTISSHGPQRRVTRGGETQRSAADRDRGWFHQGFLH